MRNLHARMYQPSREEFLNLATQGNTIPVTRRLLADLETPLSAYRKLSGEGESFLFESVEGGEHLGRYSFVGCNPRAVIRQTGSRVEVRQEGVIVERFHIGSGTNEGSDRSARDGLEVLESVMKRFVPVSTEVIQFS